MLRAVKLPERQGAPIPQPLLGDARAVEPAAEAHPARRHEDDLGFRMSMDASLR